MYVNNSYTKLLETRERKRQFYATHPNHGSQIYLHFNYCENWQHERAAQVPSNFKLYKDSFSTYNKICAMPKSKRKWFEKNDVGYQWMCQQTMKYIWVGLLIVSIFGTLFQMNY